ncbi:hypothetical protein SF83666_b67710 (plasmid) [Sinorhizobium fredii CCBAU 83666]|nr:hypothetical protein SF83666_b67710 [Sinorhizobium fredii CCBAU 83666]
MLEHHARIPADNVDIAQVSRQFSPVYDDPTPLMFFKPVYAADHRGFTGS